MRALTASDRSALIKLASSLPAGSEERRAILAGLQGPRSDLANTDGVSGMALVAGTLRYEGDTPIDKVYACTDLIVEAQRSAGTGVARAEFQTVKAALNKLEDAIKAAGKTSEGLGIKA